MSDTKLIRLYDLGNTLVRMDHASYVFRESPELREAYEQGNPEANRQYEEILQEGLIRGRVQVAALPGVVQRLREDRDLGIHNAVFSTCLHDAVNAALMQAELRQYITQVCSTFFYNPDTPDRKTVQGFRAVQHDLERLQHSPERVLSYADDKLSELQRAREGLEGAVQLYRIGEPKSDDPSWVKAVRGIVDISYEVPDTRWQRARPRVRPRPV